MTTKSLANQTPRELITQVKAGNFIKEFFKGTSRSAYFWNGGAYIIFIATLFINPEITGCLSVLASIFSAAAVFDDLFEKEPNRHYWPALGLLFWFVVIFGSILAGLYGLYCITIKPFNEWLDYKGNWDILNNFFQKYEQHQLTLDFRATYKTHIEQGGEPGKMRYYESNYKYWDKKLKEATKI